MEPKKGVVEKLYSHKPFGILILLFTACCAVFGQDLGAPEVITPAPANMPGPVGNIRTKEGFPTFREPMDSPSVQGTSLKRVQAVPLGNVDTIDSAFTHEIVRVQWRPADPIDLYIIKPVGIKKPPVVLYLYSYPFETDRFLDHSFCKFLVRNGFAAVGFASALTGQRYHDRPMKEWFVSEIDESLATTAHDVQLIIDYLADRGDMDVRRVGMFGDGSGATVAILAAAMDRRIKSLDLLDPWGDWPDWASKSTRVPENERANFLKPEWQKKAAPLDPIKWMRELKTQKIRLQFIRSVAITPVDAQAKIEASAPSNVQILHFDDAAAFKASVADGSGFDWIKEQTRSLGIARSSQR